ncbi:Dephospho-CoA kinase [Novipirellula galeiformis]|uniref:Dephospho-CoA kinase n=1 Tax=Novipirellula galeiformis TaxID=2528004 RepID=A0A5C6C9L0_9BACT|nr:dephospho-CoA kinase [Novipirellula galeiformis]TWU20597.1 Dephospho-CoA kinase [Novipirellula galeiformis]
MHIVGIVGAPAGGKSTVARYLQELGATWVNADLIAREVLNRPQVVAKLAERFGAEIVDHEGQINRLRLAALVFGDDDASRAALNYLESLTHPSTRNEIQEQIRQSEAQGVRVLVLDVPLLFESKWDRACDEIWCVDSPWADRLKRAEERGWDAAQLSKRESNQLSIEEKRRLSHRVIYNDGSLSDLHEQVRLIYSKINDCSGESSEDSHGRGLGNS